MSNLANMKFMRDSSKKEQLTHRQDTRTHTNTGVDKLATNTQGRTVRRKDITDDNYKDNKKLNKKNNNDNEVSLRGETTIKRQRVQMGHISDDETSDNELLSDDENIVKDKANRIRFIQLNDTNSVDSAKIFTPALFSKDLNQEAAENVQNMDKTERHDEVRKIGAARRTFGGFTKADKR